MIIEMPNFFSGPPVRIIFSETLTALLFRIGTESHSAHSILTFLQKQKRQCPSVTGHGLHRLGLKSIEVKLKSNEAKPSWTSTWPRWTWSEVAQGGGQVHRGQVHQSQVQVQRGAAELDLDLAEMDLAEMYLSSVRVNIVEESVVDHRVQLQCKVYEEGGKYTEAQPRCTCPSYESTLHSSRWRPCPVTDGLYVSTLTFLLLQKGENWMSEVTFWPNSE